MNFDWQTAYYFVGTVFMLAFIFFVIYLLMLIRNIKQKIEETARLASLAGSFTKLSLLRSLYKLIK